VNSPACTPAAKTQSQVVETHHCALPPTNTLPGTRDPRTLLSTGSAIAGDANSRGASRVPGPSKAQNDSEPPCRTAVELSAFVRRLSAQPR